MKTLTQSAPRLRCRGVTLVEMMITMVTTVVVLGGAMSAYIYGLKMMQFTQPKLSASDEARKAVSLLMEDVRSAFDVKVGRLADGAFVPAAPATLHLGNALRLYWSTNTNDFVIYFCDTNDMRLKRTTNNLQFTTVATAVTNDIAFSAEDFQGNILTSDVDNYVIGLTVQFYQLQYPRTSVSAGSYYDWYQLRCKATKRTLF